MPPPAVTLVSRLGRRFSQQPEMLQSSASFIVAPLAIERNDHLVVQQLGVALAMIAIEEFNADIIPITVKRR